jgi:hypothetical protein
MISYCFAVMTEFLGVKIDADIFSEDEYAKYVQVRMYC